MNMEPKGCIICGKEKRFHKADTCSRECANLIKRKKTYENRTCPVCKTLFEERVKRERRFCSEPCRLDWQSRPENIAARMERTKEAVMEKYGVASTFEVKSIQQKAGDGMRKSLKESGSERAAKIKASKLERHGNGSYNNVEKIRETKSALYGDENYNNRDKARKTMLETYGHDHAMKRADIVEKAKETLRKNYGVDTPLGNEEIKQRSKNTSLERYGTDNFSKTKEFKKKVAATWLSNIEATKQYQLILQLKANNIELLDNFTGFRSHEGYKEYNFKCTICDHEFKRKFCNPTIPICRKCHPSPTSPMTHEVLRRKLIESGTEFIENSRRHIRGYELDFVLEKHGVAIEFNGNYYHSERGGDKTKDYHLTKTKLAHENGLRLIHVFEDEITDRPEVSVSRIMSSIGMCYNRIGARNCKVVELDFVGKRNFFESNHIQGDAPSRLAYGLVNDGKLVSAMSFGSRRRALGSKADKSNDYELVRFASIIDYNVTGAFSKLLKHFTSVHKPELIVTYADIGWSGYDPKSTVYTKNGFEFDGFSRPNYWYFNKGDYRRRFHRFSYRKNVVLDKVVDADLLTNEEAVNMTEWELAQLLGMDRIWDCGNMRFSWRAKPTV